MPKAKQAAKSSRPAKRAAKSAAATTRRSTTGEVVFLNIGVSTQARAGLNKLVTVMGTDNQRGVLEKLIAAELHRRNLRMPRAT